MMLNSNEQHSLVKEVLKLEKQLEDQFAVRIALEKAFASCPHSVDHIDKNPIAKPVMSLIKEIAALEMEVIRLEKHLLTLYRTITFDHHKKNKKTKFSDLIKISLEDGDDNMNYKIMDSGIYRSLSSLSQGSACLLNTSPLENLALPIDPYHSLPLSMLERTNDSSLGLRIHDQAMEKANWISEEMVKCISSIYCELADSRFSGQEFPSSSASFSSESDSSPPCHIGRRTNEYSSVIEINFINRNEQKLRGVRHMLWSYRSLVSQLERVDPMTMKHEEKLAFWINVHNALVMHAYIVYGVPRNNMKRTSLILKAAYNVGGHTINTEVIQSLILNCRLIRPGQWIQSLFLRKTKFKVRDTRKQFAIQHQEPRLYFALCSGNRSDPQIRIFTPKRVFEELESAKDDYIQANIVIHKQCKITLPKILDLFARDSCLGPAGFGEMICPFLPNYVRKNMGGGKLWKRIEWIHHDFAFRYMISKEHVK
ncbi:uncharacterized protein LOC124915270 isoform X2 [Impatiens glandulifera]|nr:uncharacterized protein LOC124915270 isoform X2 [Impatiens glandulifera]